MEQNANEVAALLEQTKDQLRACNRILDALEMGVIEIEFDDKGAFLRTDWGDFDFPKRESDNPETWENILNRIREDRLVEEMRRHEAEVSEAKQKL